MRIGIDARMWGPEQTGIGRFVDRLLYHLVKIPSGHEFVLFALKGQIAQLSHKLKKNNHHLAALRFVPVNDRWYGWGEQLTFPRQLMKEELDLLHVPHFNVPLAYRRPFVATIHDLTPWNYPGHKMGRSFLRRFLFRRVFHSTCSRARRLMSVSGATKNDIQRLVSDRMVDVVYEGPGHVDVDAFSTTNNSEVNKSPMTAPYLFALGVWREHKNFFRLIKAFEELKRRKWPDLFLVIGGSWEQGDPALLELLKSSSVRKDIITPGFIELSQIPHWYRHARAVIVPSLAEGFGFVGLEAMNEGTPVVAARAGSLPEIYGKAAHYSDPFDELSLADSIDQVLSNQQLRTMLVAHGKDQVRRYSWRRMAENILSIYEEALES